MDRVLNASVEGSNGQERAKIYEVQPVQANGNLIYHIMKRAFDLVVSLLAAFILFIPMLLIACIIKLDSNGPVLYKQERLGYRGKPFTIYKFRTMEIDAERLGPQWASKEDGRCTRVGQLLRKTRLDEIPQLWNIFRGDMSIVGPRPERAYFYEIFETYIHGFSYRMEVKPGLTGLAQVNGGYDLKPEEKIVFDMEYISRESITLDLWCILKTVRLIFTHEGAR